MNPLLNIIENIQWMIEVLIRKKTLTTVENREEIIYNLEMHIQAIKDIDWKDDKEYKKDTAYWRDYSVKEKKDAHEEVEKYLRDNR